MTGQRIDELPAEVRKPALPLEELHAKLSPVTSVDEPPAGEDTGPEPPLDLDDTEIIRRAHAARNGDTFSRLWQGEVIEGSHSEADLALCGMLAFWTGRDHAWIDRLFRQSGLMRPKWDQRRGETTYGGRTIAEACTRCRETYRPHAETTGATAAPPPDDGLGLVSVGALLSEPEETHAWVVKDRLPAAGLGAIVGKPKAGKSTAAPTLALCVVRGVPWLGFETTQGPVIYLALEEKRDEVREHFRALGATASDPIYLLCAAAPKDALERLRVEAERLRPALIIVDPLFKFVRVEDGNDYATMTAALEPLLTLARQTFAHVLLVHHLGKGQRFDGDAILGSTAIFAAMDSALLLKRGEKYRTLSSIQRYGQDLEEITIHLDPVTRNLTAGPTRAEADMRDAGELILAFLGGLTVPVTEAEIGEAVECRTQACRAALRALVADGKVSRTGRGGKADPFHYARMMS